MVVIFPFEEKIYRDAGVPASFVGHPLVDVVRPSMTRAEFADLHKLDANKPIVTILPGSRPNEIRQNYGRILGACERLKRGNSNMQFVLAVAPNLSADFFSAYASSDLEIKHVTGATYDALAAADCAIVASGTATIEAALLGTPMVVIYRVSPVSALILGRMIRTPFFSMVNLIAGKRVVRELIQDDFTPEAVEGEVRGLLESSNARDEMKASLAEVSAKLGPGGAIERAADIFAQML
jgi:lipid-A-disaccharide synthase